MDGPRRRTPTRRSGLQREADIDRRLTDVEDMVRANRRELELQFQRIAHIQADLDKLKKR